jgi:hypothetical protein
VLRKFSWPFVVLFAPSRGLYWVRWNEDRDHFFASPYELILNNHHYIQTRVVRAFLIHPFFTGSTWAAFHLRNPIHSQSDSLDGGSVRRKPATYTQNRTKRINHTETHAPYWVLSHKPSVRELEAVKHYVIWSTFLLLPSVAWNYLLASLPCLRMRGVLLLSSSVTV